MQFPIIDAVSVPEHRNSRQAGKTVNWSGSDTLDQFQTNCKNNITKELLTSLEFSETSITYKYNCYGFRDEEFDRRSCGPDHARADGTAHDSNGDGLQAGKERDAQDERD